MDPLALFIQGIFELINIFGDIFRLFIDFPLDIFRSFPEFPHAFAQAPGNFGYFFCTEKQQDHHENNEYFLAADKAYNSVHSSCHIHHKYNEDSDRLLTIKETRFCRVSFIVFILWLWLSAGLFQLYRTEWV